MADNENAGTTSETVEAPAPAEAAQGTPTEDNVVTTLRSRNAGLDAKVTELQKAAQAAEERAQAAAQKLADYESGKVQADEALRAQLSAKEAELAQARTEKALALIAAQYPETFSVLGEAAASLSADQLAASEARFAGVPVETSAPVPVGANPPRSQAPASKRIEDMNLAELRAHMHTFPEDIIMRPLEMND